jgi:WD40 repeat protein
VWDAAKGEHRKTPTGYSSGVIAVAFSPDGTQIASGSDDTTVRVWDAVTGDHQKTLTGHSDIVMSVTFSPDGTQIASSSHSSIYIHTTPSPRSGSIFSRFLPAWGKRVSQDGRGAGQLRYSTNGKFLLTQNSYISIEGSTQGSQYTSAVDQEVRSIDAPFLRVSSQGIKFNDALVLSLSGLQWVASSTLNDQVAIGCKDGSVLSFVVNRTTLLTPVKTTRPYQVSAT